MTEPNPADVIPRQIANQVCENWEIAAFTQEWAIARDAAFAALQQSRSAEEALEEALFGLSARLLLSGFLDDNKNHAAYEKVVSAHAALSQESADGKTFAERRKEREQKQ